MPTTDVYWAQPQSLSAEELAALEAVLDDTERARARRFADAADRNAFVAAHGMLRLALSAHAGRPAQAWRFTASAAGKPELTGKHATAGIAFNLSHARTIAACVIAPGGPVGIDVETVADAVPEESFLASCCTDRERAELATLPPAAVPAAFAQLWTIKEAALKALGVGLNQPPASVECSLTPARIVRQHAGGPPLFATSYRPHAGTVFSLARPAADRDVYPVVVRELFTSGRVLRSAMNSP